MKRSIYPQLLKWKDSPQRKPLMLFGARQVGKTYILKELGLTEFEDMIYINCYKNQAVETLFSDNVDIKSILVGLSALSGVEIKPGKTFVFLDEVQEIPAVVSALKYFYEEVPEIAIAVAGSLLGVMNMEGQSFPTGKVDILKMYPMTFIEFLEAYGENKLADLLKDNSHKDLINSMLPRYTELLREYYFVGGMPEAVAEFIERKTPEYVRKIQKDILMAYEADIAKHAAKDTLKARLIFQSVPAQLAKENKKFIFGAIKKGARAADYENAIQWLVDSGLVYKVPRVSTVKLPLRFYQEKDIFKLYLLDVGLLAAMADIHPSAILIGNDVFSEYKGAFTENYVYTQLIPIPDIVTGYYSKDNSSMELDFIVQAGNNLLPIEVKAEENVKSRSLRQFITIDMAKSGLKGYRFSMKGFVSQEWMENVPLCAVEPYVEALSKRQKQ